ncbi:alpha/beta hydrolase family protein [Polaromonas sp.]|uniref:alpha/beta fold hydrolase n=1 Tax=Polaromonas sp. TaxID=1869339 RepID=UPI002487717F|nr:alpha/beta hydrolase family protein [Polaromonas sp.]MDI1340867.1 alpha/beta hydrolase [Polaromonas sp.]
MANFVLVHGAWHGGWCWQRVTLALQQQGHRVHAVTLTGLGERAHLLAPSITLDTHIDDVISAIEVEELHDVILAVHSYAGMIGTAVADRLGKHLKHLVYVDAVIPKPGESWSSTQSAATQQQRLSAAQASTRFSFPPPDPEVFGLHDADHAWVKRRQTPHPGNTYQAPLAFDIQRVAAVPRTFVNCTQPALATIEPSRLRAKDPKFWDGAWLPNSKIVELKTGHDPMISDPTGLTRILVGCA